ncbi:hypothetical protein GCM10022225_33610 [Plantactinospora mayteni]|uniref:Uncharacterized protein n=1 Tax=Plantactinospora mayteni TaxID=566021 RepID=A0ABQ4EL97_9ACTN|nr:hypothetical protein [Plantactinospora mayteni]GIG95475.1 hypothetical protein Pma05_20480 [Plantactinospora mayteni]
MNDSTRPERQVAGLARVRDEELAGLESGAAARALLASIVAEPDRPARPAPIPAHRWPARPARRLVLAAAALVVMTVAVVAGPSLLPDRMGNATSYANSAIEIRQEGDWFVARIKDPLADRSRYVEAFRAVGKDVEIELVPVSPRLVGVRIQAGGNGSGQVRASSELVSSGPTPVDCAVTPANCTLVIRISTDTTGTVRYRVGRAALPGEPTQDPVVSSGVPALPGGGGDGGTGN